MARMCHKYRDCIAILQLLIVYNTVVRGWRIKKVDCNTYELTKKMTPDFVNFDLYDFIDQITN